MKKTLVVLGAVAMMAASAGASNLPFERELTSGTYEITESFAFVAPKMESALKVADGATVTLDIAAGVEVVLRGGDAFEVWGGGAGIEVPANATLKVTGAGQLIAYGGKGANGCNGLNGGNGSADTSAGNFASGAGGAGGWGGGGAGAGIGGHGASGGGGGNGGKSVMSYDWEHTDRLGNAGDNGGAGKDGGTCGTVSIEGIVRVFAHGGATGDADGAGGAAGTRSREKGSTYYFSAFGGGGGGGGAKGGAAADIGGGGAGGYGGGGGGSGAYVWGRESVVDEHPGWGAGGNGANNGKSNVGTDCGGAGGAKGAAGACGGNGTLTVADGAVVYAAEGRYSVGRLSETVEIFYDNGKLLWVSDGTSSNLAYSVVSSGTETLGNGWYVVKGKVSRTNRILVSGAANLVLLHGSSLTVDCSRMDASKNVFAAGIDVSGTNSLCVFGAESGSLEAYGSSHSAGIGASIWISGSHRYSGSCGAVLFYGGTVMAQGGEYGAGIGGGYYGAGGAVTINGGEVTAKGAGGGKGIGGGWQGTDGSLTLGPRVFEIDDSHYREGIAVSFEVPPNLQFVSARVDDGSPRMFRNGASIMAVFLPRHSLSLTFGPINFEHRLTGDAMVSFGPFFSNAVIDRSRLPKVEDVEGLSVDYVLPDGGAAQAKCVYPLYSENLTMEMGQGNWYVVTGEVTTAALEIRGAANLILADGAKLTANGGIFVNSVNELNIYGQSIGTGKLVATGSWQSAGIGVGYRGVCGAVTINGGEVTATGGYRGAGIGGGYEGAGGVVTINGGEVTATGGEMSAGIGGGDGGNGGIVTVNGGKVMATGRTRDDGNYGSAGIGGGYKGTGGDVTINGGEVTAKGAGGGKGIGGGSEAGGGAVSINGGRVKAEGWNGLGETVTLGENVVAYDITGGEPGTRITDKDLLKKVAKILAQYENPFGPTCEGGTIELVDGVWVITPNKGVEAVTITGLPDGAKVAVKCGGYAVPSAAFVGWGEDGKTFSLALNPDGVVDGVPVKPMIGEGVDEPFVVGKGEVTIMIRTIQGLRYSLIRGAEIGAIAETVVAPTLATESQMTLKDGAPATGKAFYKVGVGK